jgi:hypothetical protein
MQRGGNSQPSVSTGSPATLELTLGADGLITSGDVPITVISGASLIFVWPDAVAFGLMVDSSLSGREPALWEIESAVGFSSSVAFGQLPQLAREVAPPLLLIRGRRYFVSVYGEYPRYGIQEFMY